MHAKRRDDAPRALDKALQFLERSRPFGALQDFFSQPQRNEVEEVRDRTK